MAARFEQRSTDADAMAHQLHRQPDRDASSCRKRMSGDKAGMRGKIITIWFDAVTDVEHHHFIIKLNRCWYERAFTAHQPIDDLKWEINQQAVKMSIYSMLWINIIHTMPKILIGFGADIMLYRRPLQGSAQDWINAYDIAALSSIDKARWKPYMKIMRRSITSFFYRRK